MRKLLLLVIIVFLVAYADDFKPSIVVIGEGIVESEPDLATVRLGVSLQDRTADKVYQQTNNTINAIIKSLRDLGIKKEDIKTDGIGLYPQYEYPSGKQKFIGYQMYHNLSIRIKSIDKVADVIDHATFAGANTVSNINFGFQEPEKLRSKARSDAIDMAKKKANEIAKAAGINLGKIMQITETSYPLEYGAYDFSGAGGGESAVVAPGTSAVRVAVTITYGIKDQ